MKKKLTVITNASGKVLGTQIGHGDLRDPKSTILISVIAADSQHLHRIEYDVPVFHSATDIQKFHQRLAKHLTTGD
jgi:hypothetical protein